MGIRVARQQFAANGAVECMAALAIKSRVAVDSHIHEGTLKRRRIERRQ